jgi:PAS domain S-box-containing protein
MVLASVGALLLGAMLSSVLMSRLLRPLNVLTQASDRLGKGDLMARAQVEGNDELAQLSHAFNRMAERLGLYQQSSLGQLLHAQQAAQAAIDSIPDPVLLFDVKGRVLNFNQAAEQLLGLDQLSQVSHVLERVEPALRRVLEQVCAHVMRGEGPYHPRGFEEAVLLHSASGVLALLPRAEPVYGGSEGLQGVTVILQDVTRLRRFDELKNDMVATVAHEFRTPLTSLRMAIHLCVEGMAGPVSEKQEALLAAAREDCERLQTTVDELLDLARLQSGRLELHRVMVSIPALLQAVVNAFLPLAREKHIQLRLELLPGLPELSWDLERMRVVSPI